MLDWCVFIEHRLSFRVVLKCCFKHVEWIGDTAGIRPGEHGGRRDAWFFVGAEGTV